jgi:predicted 2-oxoglutarate/Fe(II)-dependent dioxygenase YbiX
MIKVTNKFLTDNQTQSLISLWDNNLCFEVKDEIYRFKGIDLLPILHQLDLPNFLKMRQIYNAFRLQLVDETIEQVDYFHSHTDPYSFVIFLNHNFTGGELTFDNGTKIQPTAGNMIYFSGNEKHRVEKTKGKRFTLISFLNQDLYSEVKKTII